MEVYGGRNLTDWLESIPTFLEQLQRHRHTDDLALASLLSGRWDDYLSLLQAVLARAEDETHSGGECNGLRQLMSDIHAIAASITSLSEHYREWSLHLIDHESSSSLSVGVPQQVYSGTRGRPSYHIPHPTVTAGSSY